MDCIICQEPMVFVPLHEREKWSIGDYGPEQNSEGKPYMAGHVPVIGHGKNHVFHRQCIVGWLKTEEQNPIPSAGSIYVKMLAALLPCITYERPYKGTCPDCREEIFSNRLVENTALTADYIKSAKRDEDGRIKVPLPEGYDPNKPFVPHKRTVMEMAFMVTLLMFFTMYYHIKLLLDDDTGEKIYARRQAAEFFDLTDQEFFGFKSVGEYFLHPERQEEQEER